MVKLREVTLNDASSLAHILIESNESYRGHVPDKCLTFSKEESAKNWETLLHEGLDDGNFMLLAENSDGLPIGYCWGGPTDNQLDYAGELKQIGVLPAYHRQGIGRHMVQEVARRLVSQGIYTLCVHVLAVNPNRKFYERMGGKYVSQYPFDWDGFQTISYIYGWKDTQVLLGNST